ncbi:MAG: ribonuclease J [Myxococcota bacterium]
MLRVIPLGGLGEIGLNAMAFESRGELLLVDCGLMFPPAHHSGVELVLPDFTFLRENRARLRGVVLTHGHEDHVGALPFLLRELAAPVYGTRLTLGLVARRLEEWGVAAELKEISPRTPFPVGSAFVVEAMRVTHSIPDGVALAVRTAEELVVHTGDFKLDGAPIDGRPTDLERLGELGEEGVSCLLSDSTNAEVEEDAGSERRVAEALDRLMAGAGGRVIVTLFASNLHRVQTLLDLALRHGRKVVLTGRSMQRNVELARSLDFLRVPEALIVPTEHLGQLHPAQALVLTTGAQAEPRSALVQMTSDEAGDLRVQAGDLVVFSSRTIPGNERAVSALLDRLLARGVKVAYAAVEPDVHVSGHAGRGELRRMIHTVRPKSFVPIHGELHHLHQHLELARKTQVPTGLLLARDGDVIALEENRIRMDGRVPVGRVHLDRYGGGILDTTALEERSRLAELGLVMAVVVLERSTGALASRVRLSAKGTGADEAALLTSAADEAEVQLLALSASVRADEALVSETVTRAVRQVFKARTGKRPAVSVMVVKVPP